MAPRPSAASRAQQVFALNAPHERQHRLGPAGREPQRVGRHPAEVRVHAARQVGAFGGGERGKRDREVAVRHLAAQAEAAGRAAERRPHAERGGARPRAQQTQARAHRQVDRVVAPPSHRRSASAARYAASVSAAVRASGKRSRAVRRACRPSALRSCRVGQQPRQGPGEGRAVAGRHQPPVFAVANEVAVAARPRRHHRQAQRHRLEQRLRETLAPRRQHHQVEQPVEREHVGPERHAAHPVPRRRGGERAQLGIGRDAHHREADRRLDVGEGAQQHRLVLAPRHHAHGGAPRPPAGERARRLDLGARHVAVDPRQVHAVGHDAHPPRRRPAPDQRPRHGPAHRDGAVGDEPVEQHGDGERARHLAAGHDARGVEPAGQARQPARRPVARRVRVHDVHAFLARQPRDPLRQARGMIEGERRHLEPGGAGHGRQHAFGAAPDQHPVARRPLGGRQRGDGDGRARPVTLMGEVQDGQRAGARHVRARGRPRAQSARAGRGSAPNCRS